MSKTANCVDWFVLRQCVDLWVEAVSLRLLEDKILCGNHVVARQVGDRVSLRECSLLSLEILAARITYVVVWRILVNLENLL